MEIAASVEQVIFLSERDDMRKRQHMLEAELKDNDRRIARFVALLESEAVDVQSVVVKLRELEARKAVLTQDVTGLQPVARLAAAVVEDRLAEWRRLLRQSTTQGRSVLQRLLRWRITFVPEGTGYVFTAPTPFDKLFSGIMAPMPAFLVGEPIVGKEGIGPENTHDGDYGRLLAARGESRAPSRVSKICASCVSARAPAAARYPGAVPMGWMSPRRGRRAPSARAPSPAFHAFVRQRREISVRSRP